MIFFGKKPASLFILTPCSIGFPSDSIFYAMKAYFGNINFSMPTIIIASEVSQSNGCLNGPRMVQWKNTKQEIKGHGVWFPPARVHLLLIPLLIECLDIWHTLFYSFWFLILFNSYYKPKIHIIIPILQMIKWDPQKLREWKQRLELGSRD